MATVKSFTDLQQSKKLAEILSIESADMRYHTISHYNPYPCDEIVYTVDFGKPSDIDVPCWSLAALLEILPIFDNRSPVLSKTFDRKYRVVYHSTTYEKAIYTEDFDNPVDACVAMIEKLHELKML